MTCCKLTATALAAILAGGLVRADRCVAEPPAFSDENVGLMRELMRRRGGDPAALAQLVQLTRSCSHEKTASLYEELAAAHRRAGNLNLAAETRHALVERLPSEPAAHRSLLWLVRLYASSEVAQAHRPTVQAPSAGPSELVPLTGSATLASAQTPANGGPDANRALPAYALDLAARAAMANPALGGDSALTFQRAVAARLAGDEKSAQGWLVKLKHLRAGDPWGECARAEVWLAESRDKLAPKAAAPCVHTVEAPLLDGVLEEACWQGETMPLGNPSGAQAWLAHDAENLYLAVRCTKIAGGEYSRDDRPRPHDGNVDAFDHVRVLLDLDRDYASWFELEVDCRGWTADRAWGEASWNPQWFVAASQDNGSWTAEAAIPLTELGAPATRGNAWACRIERRAAGVQTQAWPVVEDKPVGPQRLGLLLFD